MELIKAIADASPEFIIRIDREHNLIWANKALLKNYHFDEEIFGKKCYKAFFNKTNPCNGCPLTTSIETGLFEQGNINPEYNTRYFSRAYPLPNGEKVSEVLGFINDNTENRIQTSNDLSDLYHRSQNSFITTMAYLLEMDRKLNDNDVEMKRDIENLIYASKAFFYKIKKEFAQNAPAMEGKIVAER